MKKQAGFTLIELVIVIIILGILAVTAAPKFLNLQDDAKTSTLKGLEGSLKSAGSMVYSKAILAGKEKATTETLGLGNGTSAAIAFGYPQATQTDLTKVAEINAADGWQFVTVTGGTLKSINIFPKGIASSATGTNNACSVNYAEAKDVNTPPVVTTNPCTN